MGDGLTDPVVGGAGESGADDEPDCPVTGGAALPPVIGGSSKMVALAVLVGSATLVAEIVTNVSALTVLRAA
jgi:hypothetical protein